MIEQKYKNQIKQGHRRDIGIVDEELLVNKQNKKIFRMAAYSMGVGIACVILLPLLSNIGGDSAKSEALNTVFLYIGLALIMNALVIAFSFFFLRQNIKLVLFMLNWLILPTAGIWAVLEAIDILRR